jgi:superfamily II DNA/RNA helicase
MNYAQTTPIQSYAVPLGLGGHDLMCCAQTGSGKTAAFLIPIVAQLASSKRGLWTMEVKPSAVVMAPTRELASQIHLEAQKLCHGSNLRAVCVYGGAKARPQLSELARGCDVLVATPGRLTDFVERGTVSLEGVQALVLDEADRMLDMGALCVFVCA